MKKSLKFLLPIASVAAIATPLISASCQESEPKKLATEITNAKNLAKNADKKLSAEQVLKINEAITEAETKQKAAKTDEDIKKIREELIKKIEEIKKPKTPEKKPEDKPEDKPGDKETETPEAKLKEVSNIISSLEKKDTDAKISPALKAKFKSIVTWAKEQLKTKKTLEELKALKTELETKIKSAEIEVWDVNFADLKTKLSKEKIFDFNRIEAARYKKLIERLEKWEISLWYDYKDHSIVITEKDKRPDWKNLPAGHKIISPSKPELLVVNGHQVQLAHPTKPTYKNSKGQTSINSQISYKIKVNGPEKTLVLIYKFAIYNKGADPIISSESGEIEILL
ncbi:variable surface lipoprotein [Mycoplasma enhydrae]|uniref:variable surface lipoprotein n=1 Tax=Mycoplasma enhydrae TaxID=2499220 RepID=UPI00197C958E|nr:variable surface lipoprotein [Mycoplasma enhydrae]MBN4089367.1 hypothetical protein [Mycoplasma enhydrae]MCV3733739.1 variable surface lipoprotein [Mycoplasma enhydrae]MCV3753601.1 variable surface lipoprotein [Mycoplasma enhydrae]